MSKSPTTSRQIARELYDKQQAKLDAAEKNLDAASKEITDLKGQLSAHEEEIHLLLERIKLLVLKLAHAENRPEQMALKLELKSLQEQLSRHATEKFGSSRSERRRRTDKEEKKRKKRRADTSKPPAVQLPIDEFTQKRDEEEGGCPRCGEEMHEVEGKTTDHDVKYAIHRQIRIRRHRSQHYRCNCCGTTRVAPGPEGLVRKNGKYDVSLIAMVAVDKYQFHLPIERQIVKLHQEGLRVTNQTLCDQLKAFVGWLNPIYDALHAEILTAPYVHFDLSSWRLMSNKGGSKLWQMASLSNGDVAWFSIIPKKNKKALAHLFKGYDGIVVSDGESGIHALERARSRESLKIWEDDSKTPDFLSAGCLPHARRGLFHAEKLGYPVGECLDDIAEIYALEDEAEEISEKTGEPLLEVRKRIRDTKSRAVMNKIWRWVDKQSPPAKSSFGRAIGYIRRQWKYLTVFLDHPEIPPDNNHAERELRDPVLGRKNHYGSRSVDGLHIAEVLYTLIRTCIHRGVEPYEYLLRAFRAAQAGEVLLP